MAVLKKVQELSCTKNPVDSEAVYIVARFDCDLITILILSLSSFKAVFHYSLSTLLEIGHYWERCLFFLWIESYRSSSSSPHYMNALCMLPSTLTAFTSVLSAFSLVLSPFPKIFDKEASFLELGFKKNPKTKKQPSAMCYNCLIHVRLDNRWMRIIFHGKLRIP